MKTRVIQEESVAVPPPPRPAPRQPQPAAPGGLKGLFTRHPLVAFFALAFAFSWWAVPAGEFLPFGPLFAALTVLAVVQGRPGLADLGRRMLRWRVGVRWYVLAIALPLGATLAAIGLNLALGAPVSALDDLDPWYLLIGLFFLRLINPLDGPMGEEPGWRGFALPRLQANRSPLMASLILGLIVAAWHLPLVFLPAEDLAPIFLLATVAITFMYTWIYNHTGGSVLMTIIAHSAQGVIAFSALGFTGSEESRMVALFTAAICAVTIGLLVFDRGSWRGRAPAECRIETRPTP
jgi:membrane protease YdiL (CAAX protease family)